MPSFDVVSKVDMQEVDNAVNQARKEIDQRYDFKGTHNEITLEKDSILILAADDYKLQAVTDILIGKLVRRSVSAKCLDFGKQETASHNEIRQRAAPIDEDAVLLEPPDGFLDAFARAFDGTLAHPKQNRHGKGQNRQGRYHSGSSALLP